MAPRPTHILSLCSGIGGLDLGAAAAVRRLGGGPVTVCYVEREVLAAQVLAARMAEGNLDPAPVWSDIATFDARPWRGIVDGVVAGVPCQPHSSAGKRRGVSDGERWLWPHVKRILDECQPEWLFLENVDGLLSSSGGEAFGLILQGLAERGFDAEWTVLAAEDIGAPHGRPRVFLLAWRGLADANSGNDDRGRSGWAGWRPQSPDSGAALAHPDGEREPQPEGPVGDLGRRLADCGQAVADPRGTRLEGRPGLAGDAGPQCEAAERGGGPVFPPGREDYGEWCRILVDSGRIDLAPALPDEAEAVASVCGGPDGPAAGLVVSAMHRRGPRLKALGNGVLPACAESALLHLHGRACGADAY